MKVLEEALNRNRGDYTLLEERVRKISAFETKTDEGKKSKHEAIEKLKSSMKVLDKNWQTQLAPAQTGAAQQKARSRAPGVLRLGAGPLCGALADAFGGKRA